MFGAGCGVNAGAVSNCNAPLGNEFSKFRRVVTGEAGGANMNPFQFLRAGNALQIRLAEGDVRLAKCWVWLGCTKHGGHRFFREKQLMRRSITLKGKFFSGA